MAKLSADNPASWYGTRTVSWTAACGYCEYPSQTTLEGEKPHECIHEISWFDKLWLCGCECNKDWKPVAVVIEKDGSIGAAPENVVVAEYMTQAMLKKKAKEEAAAVAAAAVEAAKAEDASEDASENVEEPEQEVVVHTEEAV